MDEFMAWAVEHDKSNIDCFNEKYRLARTKKTLFKKSGLTTMLVQKTRLSKQQAAWVTETFWVEFDSPSKKSKKKKQGSNKNYPALLHFILKR